MRLVFPEEKTREEEQEERHPSRVPGSTMEPAAKRMALANVTVEDADTLDCGVCYLPLKPPVFQCGVGHTICSRCRERMAAARRCHVCHVRMSGGYRRNIALEKLLESIRVPCANAAHGCTATPPYYDHPGHLKACPHAPCYCPQAGCGFAGSTAALLNHFADAHGWPCTTELRAWACVEVQLRDGFNAISARAQGRQYLFLLNVAWNPFGRAVSVLCLHPRASPAAPCSLEFEVRLRYRCNINHRGDMCLGHSQETTFKVGCTDLSGGLPSSENSFQFFLPKYVHPHDIHTVTASFDVLRVSMDGLGE